MQRIHLDTDLGGDLDDLCALAMLLRWPEPLDITGITVVGDTAGQRTGYTRCALALAGRAEIPVAAGADTAQGYYPYELGLPPEDRYWPEPVIPSPNPPEEAVELLRRSVEQDALILAIGPYTNLSLLEQAYPGILGQARLCLMGGAVYPPPPGFPAWGNEMDFNIQVDAASAARVLRAAGSAMLVGMNVTLQTALRRQHLDRLRAGDALAQLIARQAVVFAEDERIGERLGASSPALPADLLNFQHDPLACAVALGWRDGVAIETLPLHIEESGGLVVETVDPAGRPFQVVKHVDGPAFNAFWLDVVAPG